MTNPTRQTVVHPAWSRDAVIYQVNTRQFTPEGTLAAARDQLPRLAGLGARIVWLMPIHEIGEVNRKGSLGSPYAVKDYYSVSSELGTLADLRAFVDDAHELGLKVILDWVANHTAWDNPLATERPELYSRSWDGELTPTPWWDWDDIIDLDYSAPGMREYMRDAMVHWVREADVDGFRCDVAGFVPTDFWEDVRDALEQIKPVFMLAEWESRELHEKAFDMTYAWSWNSTMHEIAHGKADVEALRVYYAWNDRAYPREAIRMLFVSNHDKNSWEGTEFEQFGEALEAAVVLSVVSDGMPLIYNGQEAGNERRLEFFERDPITWREHPMGELYRRLFALKRETRALHNGAWGAPMIEVRTSDPNQVLAFVRDSGQDAVLAVVNLSAVAREVELRRGPVAGTWRDLATGEELDVAPGTTLTLAAWGWRVLTR
ncbi:alpha-amylase family glycosyl hydrolase [Serinibacter arcticus]|uniref:1,4-alpha-glucan branching enzyme n=1 Tax=Serinibacter arcticus TaxID=1655435 RepID=A0A4Z1E3R4_9MICO|nr:alpha-amylase family glycosyl hydrolase [Serinibacter arcticus]TGO04407.1 1,4-alpha-glucan branching enzyme [Serinibacter arcticus]